MGKNTPTILAYITDSKDRILSGDALTIFSTDQKERQELLIDLSRALRANVVQLKNGDYMIISDV